MRILTGLLVFGMGAGCAGGDGGPACTSEQEVFAWADEDGDGFGVEPIGYTCALGPNQADNNVDCDDSNPDINPGMEELCDLLDNDCNGAIDETHAKVPWYPDFDGDGFGDPGADAVESACLPPGPEWLATAGDCDDTNPDVNPLAAEICNGGIDDDCDRAADDADAGVDPLTFTSWHPDADGDGYGASQVTEEACSPPAPDWTEDDQDCHDGNPLINPDTVEVCNGGDDDCDGLIDDDDPDVDPATQLTFFEDYDGDGYGDATATILACRADPSSGASQNNLDCNDADPDENLTQDWSFDGDGDGVGDGSIVGTACLRPHPDAVPAAYGVDCDDNDPNNFPGNLDVCNDGVDTDCDGSDVCQTCMDWMNSNPLSPSGVYGIEPGGVVFDVYCDMDTDGGGWTLVASSTTTFDDASLGYHGDLQTLSPSSSHNGVWSGLRPVVQAESDIRFTCKTNVADVDMRVDLSFYSTGWYRTITTGTDSASCFNEGGVNVVSERTNNLSGVTLPFGNPYNSGVLEGEDSCGDVSDFTVDFDDRGMDSNQGDGTDWGEDDGTSKCGVNASGSAWFIFVREP